MTPKLILLAATAVFLYACKSPKEADKSIQYMDDYLSAQAKHFRFNGNVLVAENGKIVFQKSYGYASDC
jgi:CubicO group peptidase (beta-lactamase class C family)